MLFDMIRSISLIYLDISNIKISVHTEENKYIFCETYIILNLRLSI